MINKPIHKPTNPNFSSGPCAKRPGWSTNTLSNALVGRSHRSRPALEKINRIISLSRELLNIPKDYKIALVPASDTGAMEMAMWSMLGERDIEILAWESFGKIWVNDILNQLKIENTKVISANYGYLPELKNINFSKDIVFTWNGTTSGVCLPNGDWINKSRSGLTICDATSAIFSMNLPWEKLDVTTYSWQKTLGGEAQHGMIILSPKAINRLNNYTPKWPIPKIFRLTNSGKVNDKIFEGNTINTPSMLCIEDVLDSLNWIKKIGGLSKTIELSKYNLKIVQNAVLNIDWLEFLAVSPDSRSSTSICLVITDKKFNSHSEEIRKEKIDKILQLLEEENVAFDINSYRDAPLGIRIWGGATVNYRDIKILMSWLEWAYEKIVINKD